MSHYISEFQKLIDVLDALLAPDGCEWDRKQTHESLIPYLLEETYEVIEAIENRNQNALKEELGDLKTALIANSNLFLMPSIIDRKSVEGFGISFMEAASYGVGSIGGKDGGASDAIKHNETGLICDGNDLNSIYENVINFLNNKKFIEYGNAAKKFSENFHWNKIVKNYIKLIN